jgi:hypothetical protein
MVCSSQEGASEVFDVVAHDLAGQPGVTLPERVHDGLVGLGDGRQVEPGLDHAHQGESLDPQSAPGVEQDRVAGRLHDDLVEAGVVDEQAVLVVLHGGVDHVLHLDLEQSQGLVAHLGGGELTGELVEGGPDGVGLGELLLRHRPDPGPAVGLGLDEPHGLEVSEGLAHGRLADSELLHQLQLDDAVAGLVGALEDALDDELLDLLTHHGAL